MADALIIGYGVQFDAEGRVLLLHRRADRPPWSDLWWLPGDITPLSEEPDATVPRLFAHLLRQEVEIGFVETVFGEEPQTGRHAVHNGYLVTLRGALDPQPDDESNPFDAMQWFGRDEALAELPSEQAALLRGAIALDEQGAAPEPPADLDALFGEPPAQPAQTVAPAAETRQPRERRRELGREILAEIAGDPDFAPLGALGDWLIEHVWGEVWQTEQPSRRDRSIAAVALCAALRLHDALRFNARIAEANGLVREAIGEVCLQLAADAGFPYANESLALLGQLWQLEFGRFAPAPFDAPPANAPVGGGELERTSLAWARGEVWSRPQLTPRERAIVSLMAVLALGPSERIEAQLLEALRGGVSAAELDGLMPLVAVFAGVHRAQAGAEALARLVE